MFDGEHSAAFTRSDGHFLMHNQDVWWAASSV